MSKYCSKVAKIWKVPLIQIPCSSNFLSLKISFNLLVLFCGSITMNNIILNTCEWKLGSNFFNSPLPGCKKPCQVDSTEQQDWVWARFRETSSTCREHSPVPLLPIPGREQTPQCKICTLWSAFYTEHVFLPGYYPAQNIHCKTAHSMWWLGLAHIGVEKRSHAAVKTGLSGKQLKSALDQIIPIGGTRPSEHIVNACSFFGIWHWTVLKAYPGHYWTILDLLASLKVL